MGGPVTRALTFGGYAVIVAAMIVADVVARRRGRATLAHALTRLAGHRVAKWLLLAGWLWVGWHVFVRRGR
jgi:hypothetical protein